MAAKHTSFIPLWFWFVILCSIPVLWKHRDEMLTPIVFSFIVAIGFSLYKKYRPFEAFGAEEPSAGRRIWTTFLGVWGMFLFSTAGRVLLPESLHPTPLPHSGREIARYIAGVTILAAVVTLFIWNGMREKKDGTITLFGSDSHN
jgi:hypothetical protein